MAHRDFKGSVVLMSTNHKEFAYPVHRSYQEYKEKGAGMTVHSVEDTIVGGSFSTSDAEDTDYEPEISAFTFTSDSDVNTDEEASEGEGEEKSPALGSVISSQASLLGQDYGEDSDSSSSASVPFRSATSYQVTTPWI
jgi:hypothetical protein